MTVKSRSAPWGVVALGAALGVVTLLVLIAHGSVLAHVDGPVERWVIEHRTPGRTSFFRAASHFGDPGTAFVSGLVLAGVAALRAPRVGVALALAALARPLASDALKSAVGRPRPAVTRLVTVGGDAFPSGHALAATVLWGAVPLVAALWSLSPRWVRAAQGGAGVIVVCVACSRVYLGVHWVSDVLGGALVGLLLLVAPYRLSRSLRWGRGDAPV